jgi:hypothetical protein
VATSITAGAPLWVDGPPMDAQAPLRQYDVGTRVFNAGTTTATQVPGGVFPGNGAMNVTAGSGLSVLVACGYCCVPNSASPLQGGYIFGLLTAGTLTLAAADPSNSRIDIIVAQVLDTGTSASSCQVATVTGTASGSPSAPSAPANSIVLAQVLIPPGSSSILSQNITDQRNWVVAPGGILPIQDASTAPAMPASQIMYNEATGALVTGTGTAGSVAPLPVLPWAPVMTTVSSPVTDSSARGTLTVIAAATVTTDGATDIEAYYKWPGFTVSAAPLLVTLQVSVDGTVLDQAVIYPASSSVPTCGGSARAYTSGAQSNTPSAGTHTVTFAFLSASTSVTTTMNCAAGALGVVRVTPVAL